MIKDHCPACLFTPLSGNLPRINLYKYILDQIKIFDNLILKSNRFDTHIILHPKLKNVNPFAKMIKFQLFSINFAKESVTRKY